MFLARGLRELQVLLDRPLLHQKPSAARCPKPWCQGLLKEAGLGRGELRVVRCATCEGIWLDAAEKAKVDEVVARRRPPAGRPAGTTDGLVVYYSLTKLVFLALGALGTGGLGACWVLFTDGVDGLLGGLLVIAVAGFYLLHVLYRLCRWQPALIVNREGIVANTLLWESTFPSWTWVARTGVMKWADIATVFVLESQDHARLSLWISRRDPKAKPINIHVPQRALPKSRRTFVREMRRYCGGTVRIH